MQLMWALHLLLLYLVQSVTCRYFTYDSESRPTFEIGEGNEISFHSPNAWYTLYNGYPWWRVVFPSSWTIQQEYFTEESQQQSEHFTSPFLTKLGYYDGSEYHLPNFVIRPVVFEPTLHDPSGLDEVHQLTSAEHSIVHLCDEYSDSNDPYDTNSYEGSLSTNAEKFDLPDKINEKPDVEDDPDNVYIPENITIEMSHYTHLSSQSSAGENLPHPTQIYDVGIESNLPTHSNNSANESSKGSLNENSPQSEEINGFQFPHVTTESSSDFSTKTEESKTQQTTIKSSPENSHISVDSEINFNDYLDYNATSEESHSGVHANESSIESSIPSTFLPSNTSEYTTEATYPTKSQLFVSEDLTENNGNVSHSVPLLNSPNSEDTIPKYPDHIIHLNITTEKSNAEEPNGIANLTSEISMSENSETSGITQDSLSNEIVESNIIVAIANSTVPQDSSTLASPSLAEETNVLDEFQIITQEIFNADKIEEELHGQVSTNEDVNSFSENSSTSFPPLLITADNLATPTTKDSLYVEPTEPTTVSDYASILTTELSNLMPPNDSETDTNVFTQFSNFESTTNGYTKVHSSTSQSLLDSSASEIPSDLPSIFVGNINLSESNDSTSAYGIAVSSSESFNSSYYAEDTTVVHTPEQVLNQSLNVASSSEESIKQEALNQSTNALHYLPTANGSTETSATEKLGLEHSDITTEAVEQNDKFHETETVSSEQGFEILPSSPSYSKEQSISESQPPTTQHTFDIYEATGLNEQVTANPLYSSTTNFPLDIKDSEHLVNPTTEINTHFNLTQELSNEYNESGIYFPANVLHAIASTSSVTETEDIGSLNDNHESENDSVLFPYNHVLQEKDISTNYHHNISFQETNGNLEPLNNLGNYEIASSVDVHSFTEDPSNEATINVPESYQNEDVHSNVTEHANINIIENAEQHSRKQLPGNGKGENPSEMPDSYMISSKSDERTFPSSNNVEIITESVYETGKSNTQDNTFNITEDNLTDRSYMYTTTSYREFENDNLHNPQFSKNFSKEDNKYYNNPTVASIPLNYDQFIEDVDSHLSTMGPEAKYEFLQNENEELVYSHTELSTPVHTTENFIQEKSVNSIYKKESTTEDNNDGISEANDYGDNDYDDDDSAQIFDEEYSFHHQNAENPSEAILPSDVPTDYIYETEPTSFPFGGSLKKFGDGFSDKFYGLKFPEVTEQSTSLKKNLSPVHEDNTYEITIAEDDTVEQSSENPNAQEKDIPLKSHEHLTDINNSEEYPEIQDEDMYSSSQEGNDYLLPQKNKKLYADNNFGSSSLPNSMEFIQQGTPGGYHRSDIPIDNEYSDAPNSEGLLQRRRRDAIIPQPHTEKPDAQHKLPSGDFSAIPDDTKKSKNEVTFPRVKRTFGKIPLLSMFFKRPEFAEHLGFYKGKLIKNGILRPLLQKKLDFLQKKLFLTNFLAGFLDIHNSGFKRSVHMKSTPDPNPCDPCDSDTESFRSSDSKESLEDDYYLDDEYYYFDENTHEGAERSYKVEATQVDDDSDASIRDFISMLLPSFEGDYSD